MKKICALIPSYNEAGTIGDIIRQLKARGLAVYVVDDGSTDNTASIAQSEGAIVVSRKTNKGKGASLQEGFRHILKRDFDAVLVMDGDGQHGSGDIDNFLSRMEETGADVVIGNRMHDISSMPRVRIHTNRFMSGLISRIARQDIPDSQCGFRLIKKEVLRDIKLESSNYEIETELIIKAARKGFRIESVPVKTIYRNEKSKINPVLDTLRFISLLVRISVVR